MSISRLEDCGVVTLYSKLIFEKLSRGGKISIVGQRVPHRSLGTQQTTVWSASRTRIVLAPYTVCSEHLHIVQDAKL